VEDHQAEGALQALKALHQSVHRLGLRGAGEEVEDDLRVRGRGKMAPAFQVRREGGRSSRGCRCGRGPAPMLRGGQNGAAFRRANSPKWNSARGRWRCPGRSDRSPPPKTSETRPCLGRCMADPSKEATPADSCPRAGARTDVHGQLGSFRMSVDAEMPHMASKMPSAGSVAGSRERERGQS